MTRAKLPPSKSMSRKEKRKAERKLKKARRDAFNHRDFRLIETLRTVDTAFKAKCQKERAERLKLKKKKKKVAKKEVKKQEEDARIQGLKLAIQKDEKELKQLEKNLNFRKKKGKTTVPTSFTSDGLDYILDATDSEKIKSFEDAPLEYASSSDSELGSDSDFERSMETELDADEKSKWDQDAKASKSILKDKKLEKVKKKSVKFQSESEDERSESTNEASDISDIEEDDIEDDDSKSPGDSDQEPDDPFSQFSDDSVQNEIDEKTIDPSLAKAGKKRKLDEESTFELKEDIYGRLRDKDGNIVKSEPVGTYIPPAKRAMLAKSGEGNAELKKKLKGLLNRVSEGTIQAVSSQIESLYFKHSRADMNNTLATLVIEAVLSPILSPDRLVAEVAMLFAVLHSNVGMEVGAFFLQKLVTMVDENLREPNYGAGKSMENLLLLISNMYNFRIVHSKLIFDIMGKLIDSFTERDIELILFMLKSVGFSLRKDDPVQLKQVILDIQSKARGVESSGGEQMETRIRFMLDVLMAVKNNNMRKIPSYDPTHVEHLRKIIKSFLKGQSLGEEQLTIGLDDLLKADQVGRWWIIGSAWEGRTKTPEAAKDARAKTETSFSTSNMNKQMLKLAKQQGMNTDVRKHIFCIVGTSEDFEDAFSRLLRLGLNRTQEREIIHVLLHCCLNEREYNPYYSYLAQKFCAFDRRFTMTVQFSLWDKFKEMDTLDKGSRSRLAHLVSHLLLSKGLSLSIFKVIEFGMESKKMIRFMSQVLTDVLSSPNETTVMEIFQRIAPFPKLKSLRQGLQVFMRIHLKPKKSEGTTTMSSLALQQRIEKAESSLFSHQSSHDLL